MEFVTLGKERYFNVGNHTKEQNELVPSISGIDDDERMKRGEIREVVVDFRQKYTTDKRETINSGEYRLYVKDSNREIEIFDGYKPIEKSFLHNYFIINTQDLIPNTYFIDIRVKQGRETKYFKKVGVFRVVNDVTERYS